MALIESFILLVIVGLLIYKWSTSKYHVLTDRGVIHEKPKPFVGNFPLGLFWGKTSFVRFLNEKYEQYKDHKVYGFYSFIMPVIIVRDVELIKKIGIKDFDSFVNHRANFDKESNELITKSLIALEDRQWKEMRNTLTPSFTGSKMRLMFELINECCLEGVKYLERELESSGNDHLDLELKEYFTRFANDVIGSAAFGIKVNSFKDKTNEFYTFGRNLTNFKGWVLIKALLVGTIPKVTRLFRLKVFDETMVNYFKRLVIDAMKYREEHKIIRPDMIQLLLEAKHNFEQTKGEQSSESTDGAEFSDDDLLAQCLLFFFAGFETVSTCLCFTVHELLENPEVQQRLYEEIMEMEESLDGKPLNYDALMKMKYMDMVISESLRKWPPAVSTDRLCSADYKLTDDEGNLVVDIKKDDTIFIPIMGLQHDPENFPEPEKFIPERFSEENKSQIKPMTYLPFGIGPRNCIGNRFALMETKAIIYHLVRNFKISASDKTAKDIMNSLQAFVMQPKELFWARFTPRNN